MPGVTVALLVWWDGGVAVGALLELLGVGCDVGWFEKMLGVCCCMPRLLSMGGSVVAL